MSATGTLKGLEDLTENEYQKLVELGAEVQACRAIVNFSRNLSFLGVLNDAEYAFTEACEEYGADPDEMRMELA